MFRLHFFRQLLRVVGKQRFFFLFVCKQSIGNIRDLIYWDMYLFCTWKYCKLSRGCYFQDGKNIETLLNSKVVSFWALVRFLVFPSLKRDKSLDKIGIIKIIMDASYGSRLMTWSNLHCISQPGVSHHSFCKICDTASHLWQQGKV